MKGTRFYDIKLKNERRITAKFMILAAMSFVAPLVFINPDEHIMYYYMSVLFLVFLSWAAGTGDPIVAKRKLIFAHWRSTYMSSSHEDNFKDIDVEEFKYLK